MRKKSNTILDTYAAYAAFPTYAAPASLPLCDCSLMSISMSMGMSMPMPQPSVRCDLVREP